MKQLIIASLITLAAFPFVMAQTPTSFDKKKAEEEVRQAIEQYRVALIKGDTAALQRIWADDYTFINGRGAIVTKSERLANLKSGATNLDTINREEEPKIRIYGDDIAIAIGGVTLKGQYSGKATSGQFASGMVWAKLPTGWQLVCNQITPVTSQ